MSLAREMAAPLDCGTNLSDLLSSALPLEKKSSESSVSYQATFDFSRTSYILQKIIFYILF